jgi:thiamine-monophosphate kinase
MKRSSATAVVIDEKEIIRILSSALGISSLDDIAAVSISGGSSRKKPQLVFKADMLVGSTDVPAQMEPWQAARKSIVSCASDLAAKGAAPVAAMISLGLPSAGLSRKYVEGLARGFKLASEEFGVKIVGGDTNEANDLVIDCSMIGRVVKGGARMPARSGARPGDAVVVSGKFGYSACGLAVLLGRAQPAEKGGKGRRFARQAVDSVLKPLPRQKFGTTLARFFSSSIDSSDGLAVSLYELAGQSKVDIRVSCEGAKAEGVDSFAKANDLDAHELVFHGGEEYEIVATVPKSKLRRAAGAAKRAGLDLHVIGRVVKGAGNVYVDDDYGNGRLLENRGYLHFAGPGKEK